MSFQTENILVLDYYEKIIIDHEETLIKNYQAIFHLREGLHQLALQVRAKESQLYDSHIHSMYAGISAMDNYINCTLHWFSTSIVNYFRLVALLDLSQKNQWTTHDISYKRNRKTVKIYCDTYAKKIIPEIYTWRNKVSAHFAITDPYADDNIATMEYSIMPHASYIKPYYFASAVKYHSGGHTMQLPSWALTKVYEELTSRFWPEMPIPILKLKKDDK